MRRCCSLLVLLVLSSLVFAGCGDDHDHDDHDHDDHTHGHDAGPASGSTCPDDSTLTYDNFGREFMESYCTRCHDSQKTGDARMDAPLDHDFDTVEGVRDMADHIDTYAAAGPNGVNTFMPPDGDLPTEQERRRLGEWLACGAP